jgi:hypothetical protein
MERFLSEVLSKLLELVPTHELVRAMVSGGCVEDLDQRLIGLSTERTIKVLIHHLSDERLMPCLQAINAMIKRRYRLKREVLLVSQKVALTEYRYLPLTNGERGLVLDSAWPLAVDSCFAQLAATGRELKERFKKLAVRESREIPLFEVLSRLGTVQANWTNCSMESQATMKESYRVELSKIRSELAKLADAVWICERTLKFEASKDTEASNGWPVYAR